MRRRTHLPPDLTSLFDVMFIVVFVSLINAAIQRKATDDALAAQVSASASAALSAPAPALPSAKPPAPAPSESALRSLALAALGDRPTLIARVSKDGTLVALDATERHITLDVPLIERVPDPDVALAYLGDRSAELRICRVAALHLGVADLAPYLVIIAPEAPLSDLTVALVDGLRRDADRCLTSERAVALLVDPGDLP
jgi:hypothetical protein